MNSIARAWNAHRFPVLHSQVTIKYVFAAGAALGLVERALHGLKLEVWLELYDKQCFVGLFIDPANDFFGHRHRNLRWLDSFLSHGDELELAHCIDCIRFERETDATLLRVIKGCRKFSVERLGN